MEELIIKYELIGKSWDEISEIIKRNNLAFWTKDALEYINQNYTITPDVMRELKKDENVRRILDKAEDLSKEKYLTFTTPSSNGKYHAFRVSDFKKGIGSGVILYSNEWVEDDSLFFNSLNYRKSTPEEIKEMLIKKLESDGLKVGCMVEDLFSFEFYVTNTSKKAFRYVAESDKLNLGTFCVYSKGKFAKIIQPELTLEQKVDKMWDKLKLYEDAN